MGNVAYKKSTFDGATPAQQEFLKAVLSSLKLGVPAEYTDGTDVWYVFSDRRITPRFVENLAWANTVIADITTQPDRDYPTTEIVQVEQPVRVQVEVFDENGDPFDPPVFVWQDHPTDTELVDVEQSLGDSLTLASNAQATVGWFKAANRIPNSWTPVEEE